MQRRARRREAVDPGNTSSGTVDPEPFSSLSLRPPVGQMSCQSAAFLVKELRAKPQGTTGPGSAPRAV